MIDKIKMTNIDLVKHGVHIFDANHKLRFAFTSMVCAANTMVFYRMFEGYAVNQRNPIVRYSYHDMKIYATIR